MSCMVRLNLLNAQVTPLKYNSEFWFLMLLIFFFSINLSSIKSEPQKSIFFDFRNFQSCLIAQTMIEKLIFFLKVLLNLVFGIVTPYKQISICPYKHRYAHTDSLLNHKNSHFGLVVGCRYFFSYRALSFMKMKN